MKKLSFITLSLLLLGGGIRAQEGLLPEANLTAGVDVGGTFPHFNSTIPVSGSQIGDFSHFRLIGKVYAKHNGSQFITQDSITYKYGYGRGGDVTAEAPNDDQNILFDESYTYQYNPATNSFINKLKRTQTFDNANHVTNLTYSNWKDALSEYKDSARYLYSYSADGKMTHSASEVWFGTIWAQTVTATINYNSYNNITKMSSKLYEIEFMYGTGNSITQTIDKTVRNGKLMYNERKTYTYQNGVVATYTLEKWDYTIKDWIKTKRWEYSNTGTPNVEEEVEYKWNGTGWLKYARNYFYHDASRDDVLIEKKMQLYNASQNMFVNTRTELWSYNSNNQPTMMISKTWNDASGTFVSTADDEEIRFLYEYYNPTSISNTSLLNTNISTYPTPAGSQVTIAVKWNKPQNFDLMVFDIAGKVLYNTHIESAKEYQQTISVSSLPSGSYFVKLVSPEAQLTERIIVAH